MYNIDTAYMNECFKRAISEDRHAIHCNDNSEVIDYLVSTYNMDRNASHVTTRSGQTFEIRLSMRNNMNTTYVTLISI